MKAFVKGFLFAVVVISFIAASPSIMNSNGSVHAAVAFSDYSVSGYLAPVSDLSSVYFVGMYDTYFGEKGYFFQILNGDFLAGQTTPFSFIKSYDGYAPSAYTILAIHASPEFDGVTVGSNTIATGTSWDSLFGTQYTQQTFNALLSGSFIGQYLEEFYTNNADKLGAPLGNHLTLVNFSNASPGGTAYASSVPLPASLLLFGPGLAGIALLRRRFKK